MSSLFWMFHLMKRYETKGTRVRMIPLPADRCAQPSEDDPLLRTISHGLVVAQYLMLNR